MGFPAHQRLLLPPGTREACSGALGEAFFTQGSKACPRPLCCFYLPGLNLV